MTEAAHAYSGDLRIEIRQQRADRAGARAGGRPVRLGAPRANREGRLRPGAGRGFTGARQPNSTSRGDAGYAGLAGSRSAEDTGWDAHRGIRHALPYVEIVLRLG